LILVLFLSINLPVGKALSFDEINFDKAAPGNHQNVGETDKLKAEADDNLLKFYSSKALQVSIFNRLKFKINRRKIIERESGSWPNNRKLFKCNELYINKFFYLVYSRSLYN